MANLRHVRRSLKVMLEAQDWLINLGKIADAGISNVGALFSFLARDPTMMHRAAKALGMTVAKIYQSSPEAARNIIRRFMWHMNEESANIGWGIPAAFAESLVECRPLADAYGRILISYIMDLGFDDNYCDHDILRRTCYWGVGRLAQARPEIVEPSRIWLIKGLQDQDSICKGMAAWALSQLPPDFMDAPGLKVLADSGCQDICEIFDGYILQEFPVNLIAKQTLQRDTGSPC